MTRRLWLAVGAAAAALAAVMLLAVLWGGGGGAYHERFDSVGDWGVFGTVRPEGVGAVEEGKYHLYVPGPQQRAWSLNQGATFGDGVYSVEVTQLEGPLRSGYGLIWRAGTDAEGEHHFYFFIIGGNGMISGGYCVNDCLGEERKFTEQGWLSTEAIRQGLGVTNTISVHAEGGDFAFYINDEHVWSASDPKFAEGAIGLMVESYERGGPLVQFDNFRVGPLE